MNRSADFWREFDLPLLGKMFPVAEHDDRVTTQALGEEGDDPNWDGPVTTMATGEEGDDTATTQALGEEGDDPNWDGPSSPIDPGDTTVTSDAIGEEGDDPNWGGPDTPIDPGDGAGHFSTDVGSADNWETGGL